MTGQALENAVALFRSHYREVGIYQSHLYEGIPTLLKNLKALDYRLYVATSKPTLAATEIAKRLGIAPYFTEIVGSSPLHKTKADVIKAILAAENRADCLMIGDTKLTSWVLILRSWTVLVSCMATATNLNYRQQAQQKLQVR